MSARDEPAFLGIFRPAPDVAAAIFLCETHAAFHELYRMGSDPMFRGMAVVSLSPERLLTTGDLYDTFPKRERGDWVSRAEFFYTNAVHGSAADATSDGRSTW